MKNNNFEELEKIKDHIKETHFFKKGIIKGTKSKFGFLIVEEGNDIFIPPKEMEKVFQGDKVEVLVKREGEKEEVKINQIIKSDVKKIVGLFINKNDGFYVIADNKNVTQEIRVPKSMTKNAKHSQFVKAEIIEHPILNKRPKARIVSVIGDDSMPGIENDFVISKYNLPYKTSFAAKKEVVETNYKEKFRNAITNPKRADLTHLPFITIDGENTMDVDDAIFTQKEENGWRLWVAVSDVSEFIELDSEVDEDAFKKSSSVYFNGKMIPMLPSDISIEMSSLKEGKNKLAVVAEMLISEGGELLNYKFQEAIVRSRAKLNYSEVESYILNKDEYFEDVYGHISEHVTNLFELHKVLNNNRKVNHILPWHYRDYRMVLDSKKKIRDVRPNEYKVSNKMVEECMVVANMAAADYMKAHLNQGVFKIHDGVNESSVESLKTLLVRYLPEFKEIDIKNINQYKEFIYKSKQLEFSDYLDKVLSLYMNKSRFSISPFNHFAMGLNEYTYFTSPNRRYVDLMVHRLVKSIIKGENINVNLEEIVSSLNKKTLNIEKAVEEAENWLKCIYMNTLRDSILSAEIISANKTSIKVKILENGIVGVLPVSTIAINEESKFDEVEFFHEIEGSFYKISDIINVKVKNINFKNKTIIFKKN